MDYYSPLLMQSNYLLRDHYDHQHHQFICLLLHTIYISHIKPSYLFHPLTWMRSRFKICSNWSSMDSSTGNFI
eukprot:bmy_09464T0